MITMIYEKTLTRKSFGTAEDDKPKQQADACLITGNGVESDQSSPGSLGGQGFVRRLRSKMRKLFSRTRAGAKAAPQEEKKQPASMGKILNLMRYAQS